MFGARRVAKKALWGVSVLLLVLVAILVAHRYWGIPKNVSSVEQDISSQTAEGVSRDYRAIPSTAAAEGLGTDQLVVADTAGTASPDTSLFPNADEAELSMLPLPVLMPRINASPVRPLAEETRLHYLTSMGELHEYVVSTCFPGEESLRMRSVRVLVTDVSEDGSEYAARHSRAILVGQEDTGGEWPSGDKKFKTVWHFGGESFNYPFMVFSEQEQAQTLELFGDTASWERMPRGTVEEIFAVPIPTSPVRQGQKWSFQNFLETHEVKVQGECRIGTDRVVVLQRTLERKFCDPRGTFTLQVEGLVYFSPEKGCVVAQKEKHRILGKDAKQLYHEYDCCVRLK